MLLYSGTLRYSPLCLLPHFRGLGRIVNLARWTILVLHWIYVKCPLNIRTPQLIRLCWIVKFSIQTGERQSQMEPGQSVLTQGHTPHCPNLLSLPRQPQPSFDTPAKSTPVMEFTNSAVICKGLCQQHWNQFFGHGVRIGEAKVTLAHLKCKRLFALPSSIRFRCQIGQWPSGFKSRCACLSKN